MSTTLRLRGLRFEVFCHQQRSSAPLIVRCVRGAGPEGKTALTLVIIIHAYFCWSEVSSLYALKRRNFLHAKKYLQHLWITFPLKNFQLQLKCASQKIWIFFVFTLHLLLLSAFILFVFLTTSEFTLLCYRLIWWAEYGCTPGQWKFTTQLVLSSVSLSS